MKLKLTALASALFLLAACETAGDANGGANGAGANGLGNMNDYPAGSIEQFTNAVGDRVFFELDSSTLSSEAQATLERQAQWLKTYKDYKITVEGHADERGTREYNLALGERRATAAKKYLANLGLENGRISTISYGKERPAVTGSDESAWSQNRRAVTVLSK